MFVTELKNSELSLKEEFIEILPKYCSACESPLEINLTLTELKCSNPNCTDKIVMRIRKICEAYGIKHFGESSIEKWVEAEDIVNPLELFNVYDGKLLEGISPTLSDKVVPQILASRSVRLWEFLANAQLPYIQSIAKTLLKGYDSLEAFYEDLEDGGVDFIQRLLGIADQYDDYGNEIASIQAVKIYTSLVDYKEELLSGVSYMDIIQENTAVKEFIIVASDEVGGDFATKRQFYDFIKQRYAGKAVFTLGSSVTKKTDIVIWKGFDGTPARLTTKVKRTYELYEKGVEIQGYTANEFISAFDEAFHIN